MTEFSTKLENIFYHKMFEPWLDSCENNSMFMNYSSDDIIYSLPEKGDNIDFILCNWSGIMSVSVKVREKYYQDIFFETTSNCNNGSAGWGFTSSADIILYCVGIETPVSTTIAFDIADVRKLNINRYAKRFGTTNIFLKTFYRTEGRIIPFSEFKHEVLFSTPMGNI